MNKKIFVVMIIALFVVVPVIADVNFTAHFNLAGTGTGATAAAAPSGIQINAFSTDASSMFSGVNGSITGDYWVNSAGTYLNTTVDATGANGSRFDFSGSQNLAGYTNNLVGVGAYSEGSTASEMNLGFNGSSYTDSSSRFNGPVVSASGSTYGVGVLGVIQDKTTGINSAKGEICLEGNGAGSIDHSTTWYATSLANGSYGWGSPDTLSMSSSAHSETNLINVAATGIGSYFQSGFGANSLNYNGAVMPGGGSMVTSGTFNGGFTFSPSVLAN